MSRKGFLLLWVFLIPTYVLAQQKVFVDHKLFKFENKQLVSAEDGKDFVIVQAEGYGQKELFQKILLGLNNIYKDIDKIVTKIEYDAITVNAYYKVDKEDYFYSDEKDSLSPSGYKMYKKVGWAERFVFKFKDGKIRIDMPTFSTLDAIDLDGKSKVLDYNAVKNIKGQYYSINVQARDQIILIINTAFSSTEDDW